MAEDKKDIEETIADSQLDKLMGNETPEETVDDRWSTPQDDLFNDGLDGFLYNPDEVVEDDYLPSYMQKPAKNKKKIARPRPKVDAHEMQINEIVEEVFGNFITSFDSRAIVINKGDYYGFRKWIRECVQDGIVFDPDMSHYRKIKE